MERGDVCFVSSRPSSDLGRRPGPRPASCQNLPMEPILPKYGASRKPGAVQISEGAEEGVDADGRLDLVDHSLSHESDFA